MKDIVFSQYGRIPSFLEFFFAINDVRKPRKNYVVDASTHDDGFTIYTRFFVLDVDFIFAARWRKQSQTGEGLAI